MRLPPTWRELGVVILTSTIVGFTLALTYPLLTVVLEREGYSPLVIGLNSAASGVGIFLIYPYVDRIVARLGPAGCLRLALLTAAACTCLFPLWVNPWFWLVVRLVYGAAAALMFVLSEASVNGLAPDAQRGRVLGLYATLFSLGYAGGPLVLALAGTEGAAPFLVAAALFALGLIPTFFMREIGERLRPAPGGHGRDLFAGTWRAATLALACIVGYAFIEAAHFAMLPVWAIANGTDAGQAAALVGIWLSGNILFQVPAGWVADRVPRPYVITGVCALATATLLLLPLAAGRELALWPLLVLSGGTTGALYTLGLTLVGERFRGPELTAANTALVMTFQIGMIAGPILVGVAMQAAGPAGFQATLIPILIALMLFARRTPRPAVRQPAA